LDSFCLPSQSEKHNLLQQVPVQAFIETARLAEQMLRFMAADAAKGK
jgi:hypothetical protein